MADDDFLRELGGIEAVCQADSNQTRSSLCLYRVVPGLSEDGWGRLKQKLQLHDWSAAPPERLRAETNDARVRRFLLREMDRARLCQLPLALALVEPEARDASDAVFDLVGAQLRSFDHAVRLDGGVIAVVLSGTPLAAAERLIGAMLRRIRQICEPSLVCSAGLVGYGGLVKLTVEALLERAEKALDDARRLGGNRLEVPPSADAVLASRETLVRASEKHFLFTGRKLPEPQG